MAEADLKIDKPVSAKLRLAFAVRMDDALAVRPFVSSEAPRYYLNGVFVQPAPDGAGVLCVATDGHRMGVQRSPTGVCKQPTIVRLPREIKMPAKAELKKSAGRAPWLVCMSNSHFGHLSVVPALTVGKHCRVEDDTAQAAVERLDYATIRIGNAVITGKFPDWKRALPAIEDGACKRAFRGEYLASFASGGPISITGNGADAPHVIRTMDHNFTGIVMPMRWDTPTGTPEWLTAKSEA